MQALDEAFRIGREANIPVEIWHLKVSGRQNWGKMRDVIAAIETARASGVDVTANQYPYVASATSLGATVLCCHGLGCCAARAESTGPRNPKPQPGIRLPPRASSAETAIEGSLAGTAGNYTVTDKSGMVYKLQLADDSHNADTDKYVGQDVPSEGHTGQSKHPILPHHPDSKESKESSDAGKSQTIMSTSSEKLGYACSAIGEATEKK